MHKLYRKHLPKALGTRIYYEMGTGIDRQSEDRLRLDDDKAIHS